MGRGLVAMPAVLTPFAGLVARVGPGCEKYGDPHEWCCCISIHNSTAVIEAVDRNPTRKIRESLRKVLSERGISNVIWVRKKKGNDHIAGPFLINLPASGDTANIEDDHG